jgi:Flp pilus assembly protein TadD
MRSFLDKINTLTNVKAAAAFTAVGLVVYCRGLTGPFQGDDDAQIIYNPTVHSLSNIRRFYEGGTFYDGSIHTKLIGEYYRPLMTTVFSVLYSLFGQHSFYFHLTQLIICIGSAYLLYLFFRYSFKPLMAFILSLMFLVHPLNSQIIYAIPNMQDALFFFFGILSLWLLVRFSSVKILILAVFCLFLSLLAKESAVLFIAVDLAYLYWWKKERILSFISILALPVLIWAALRINAVGIISKVTNAPIQQLSLGARLMNLPEITLFYTSKFIFPYKLASGYYWIHPNYSIRYFLLPLCADLIVLAAVIFVALKVKQKASRAEYYTYVFFGLWASLGLLLCSQIVASDMTVSEAWFYFPMVGVLGMIGISIQTFSLRLNSKTLAIIGLALVCVLGTRTMMRASDWSNAYILASRDIVASPQDYTAYIVLASDAINQGNYALAGFYAHRSINIFPTYSNYNDLGIVLVHFQDYSGAFASYSKALHYEQGDKSPTYIQLALLTLVQGNETVNQQLLLQATTAYPEVGVLWLTQALFDAKHGDNPAAKTAIIYAAQYGQAPESFYEDIMKDQSFTTDVLGQNIEF